MNSRVDTCPCGGPVYATTDGNGRSIEACDRCGAVRLVPRARAIDHPLHAEHERKLADARARIEAERVNLPLCAQCRANHVGHVNAEFCFDCVQDRRRAKDRIAKAAARERATEAVA